LGNPKAVCNGSFDDTSAFQQAALTQVNLVVLVPAKSICTLNANVTLGSKVSLQFEPGGQIKVNSPYTLTLVAPFVPGVTTGQIFTGAGTVVFQNVHDSYPEWFGAIGNGSTDDSNAFNKIFAISVPTIVHLAKNYVIASSISYPDTFSWDFTPGGVLSPGSGQTIALNGNLDARMIQIFSGLGSVAIFSGPVYPQWYGAKCDDVADDVPGFTRLINSGFGGTVIINAFCAINTNLTVPTGINLNVPQGGFLTVGPGATLTINGPFYADTPTDGSFGVFVTSTGTILFSPMVNSAVNPMWWGAIGDGIANDQPMIQAMLNSGSTNLDLLGNQYAMCPGLTLNTAGAHLHGLNKYVTNLKMIDGCQASTQLQIGIPGGAPTDGVIVEGIRFDGNNNGGLGLATGVSAYNNSATYYSDGFTGSVGGGGPQTVLSNGSCSVSVPCTVYKVLQNGVTGIAPPNATYWQPVQAGITINGNGLIIGVNGSHVKVNDNQMVNGQIGLFWYAGTYLEFNKNYVHNFADTNQYMGNDVAVGAIITATGANYLQVRGNTFDTIYAGTLGPAATSAILPSGDNVTVTDNTCVNVINRGGGSLIGTASQVATNWVVSNNVVGRTIGQINHDQTNGIEVETSFATITGNVIEGFDSGVSVSGNGFVPQQQAYTVVTGNTIIGDNCALSGHDTPFCYGVFLFGNNTGTASSDFGMVSGNNIYNTYYGVINNVANVGNRIGINNFGNVQFEIVDNGGGALFVPPEVTESINADTTINVAVAATNYYGGQTLPLLTNGVNAAATIPGTVYHMKSVIFIQNTSGGSDYHLAVRAFMGHFPSTFVYFAPEFTGGIVVLRNTTRGVLNLDLYCTINVVATSGGSLCQGTGIYDDGNLNYKTLNWFMPVNGWATNALSSSDLFGLNFFSSDSPGADLTVQMYNTMYEVKKPMHTN
jgi:hypothetical protein